MSAPPVAALISLEAAAAELGCHVETLRRRIRRGKLTAQRGPRGAYLVDPGEVRWVVYPRKGRPIGISAPLYDEESLRSVWHLLRDLYWRLGADEDRELVMLEIAGGERGSHLAPATARLSDVHHLRMAGWTYREIAAKLGISIRHASRLGHTDPIPVLRRDLRRLGLLAEREATEYERLQHEEVLDELRGKLEAEGIRQGPLTRADLANRRLQLPKALRKLSRKAVIKPRPTRQQRQILIDAGLTDQQITAVMAVGLTPDELNALMLRGLAAPGREPTAQVDPS